MNFLYQSSIKEVIHWILDHKQFIIDIDLYRITKGAGKNKLQKEDLEDLSFLISIPATMQYRERLGIGSETYKARHFWLLTRHHEKDIIWKSWIMGRSGIIWFQKIQCSKLSLGARRENRMFILEGNI